MSNNTTTTSILLDDLADILYFKATQHNGNGRGNGLREALAEVRKIQGVIEASEDEATIYREVAALVQAEFDRTKLGKAL